MHFHFSGEIPASKSILNRLLILQSYSPTLQIYGDSLCDDVTKMKSALPLVLAPRGEAADCGAAGTTMRFLALRASRIPGKHLLTGSDRLLSRPQRSLLHLLEQLGVSAKLANDGLHIEGDGWKKPQRALQIDRSQSSQFCSALLLNSWNLDFDLESEEIGALENSPSEGYLEMTKQLVRRAGLPLNGQNKKYAIPKKSTVNITSMIAEPDVSSGFALAALGTMAGEVEIRNFPQTSLQPDAIFPKILRSMGARIEQKNSFLRISKAKELCAIHVDLRNSPDLFPVLSVLCAFASGESRLYGAPHLAHKESSRIESTAYLLKKLGCHTRILPDGMEIKGGVSLSPNGFLFDPQDDHRLAMAAAVAKIAGAKIQITDPGVVHKSFPEFWELYREGCRDK